MTFAPHVFAVVPPTLAPQDDDALQSYAAMDDALASLPASMELGSAILPCQQPCIELTVTDEDNQPLAKVAYRLLQEDATLAEGTLDANGFVSIAEKEVPAGDWNIEIVLQRDDSTQQVERADIFLRAAASQATDEDSAGQVKEQDWLPFKEPSYPWA